MTIKYKVEDVTDGIAGILNETNPAYLQCIAEYCKDEAECCIWQGRTNKSTGLGYITYNDKTAPVNRVIYKIAYKQEVPAGMTIKNNCNKKLCANPQHFELVEQADREQYKNKATANKTDRPLSLHDKLKDMLGDSY